MSVVLPLSRRLPVALPCTFENKCPISASPYRYQPNVLASVVFICIFCLSLIGYLAVACRVSRGHRLSFTVPICFACVLEIVGYSARLVSWNNPFDIRFYAVSTSVLTVAPVCISVGIYTNIWRAVTVLGTEHSLINPAHYAKLLYADALALALQVAGLVLFFVRATAPVLIAQNTVTPAQFDTHIGGPLLSAGLAIQLLSISIFVVLFSAVLVRASLAAREFGFTTFHVPGAEAEGEGGYIPLGSRFKIYVAVASVSFVCLLARNLYAVMSAVGGGLGGEIAANEALFTGLDGLMVSQAVVGLVAVHPSYFLDNNKAITCRRHEPTTTETKHTHGIAMGKYRKVDATGARVDHPVGSQRLDRQFRHQNGIQRPAPVAQRVSFI